MIKLYLMEVSPLQDAKCFKQGLALVEPERRENIKICGQEKSRVLWLAAGLLAAYAAAEAGEQNSWQDDAFDSSYADCISLSAEAVIKRLFSLSPAKIEKTPDGKPYYADRQGLFLSLSHSGEYAVCAVSDLPIGVDIQEHRDVKHNVWKRISCPGEKAAFAEEKDFYRLWTAKEACVKCTGKGLSKDFRELFTDFDKKEMRDTVTGEHWRFHIVEAPKGYSLAVCVADKN